MLRPKQRISTSEKTPKWYSESARYYASACIPLVDNKEVDILYRAANGEFDENDYLYVTNPLNSNISKFKRFPSKMRNFDIISSTVMLLMGEKRKRGLNYTVIARNSGIESEKEALQNELVDKMLVQQIIEQVVAYKQANGEQFDMAEVEQLSVEKIKKQVGSLQDKLAIQGQLALDYIRDYAELDSKFMENWMNFLVTARCVTFKEPYRDEVLYESVSPKEIKHLSHSRVRQLEDSEAITRRVRMPVTEVIDKFQGVEGFTEPIIKDIEAKYGYQTEGFSNGSAFQGKTEVDTPENRTAAAMWNTVTGGSSKVQNEGEGILVEHVVWTSMVKVGLVRGSNIFGEPFEQQVDEDFTPMPGEKVEWLWVAQKEHAYIIDDRYVIGGQSLPHTRADVTKPDACKNPYNGKILNMRHVNPTSIVKKGIVYQIKYNIIHYYIEKTMAKNMDKIVIFPLGLIADDKGHTTESTMYYAQANGFLFVDETNKNFQTALNGVKVLDASLSQHIDKLYQYLQIIKQEWESIIGITPARKGQSSSSDGKALMENSVFRSSIMTEEYFAQIEELEQRDLQGLMEISKYAFSEGKKSVFLNKDLKKVMLNLDGESFAYGDYLIRVSNSGRDLEQLERAKSNAQAIAQNTQGKATPMLKILRSNNLSQLTEEMEQMEAQLDQMQADLQQKQMESTKAIADEANAIKEKELAWKYYNTDKNADVKIATAEMEGEVMLRQEKFNTENSGEDVVDFMQHNLDRERLNKDQSIKEREINSKEKMNKEDNDTKRYVADKSVKVATVNK